MLALSLVIVTFNEEKNIERCIASVPWASEVIVLDSFSTDKTIEIARKMGARVYQEAWKGYGPSKLRATNLASYDWILSLDADEALSPELSTELQDLLSNTQELRPVYSMPRKSWYLQKWITHGGWYPDRQQRLFNRQKANWNLLEVHEKIVTTAGGDNTVGELKTPILHWVFEDITDQVATNNKYSSLGAIELQKKSIRFSCAKLLYKPTTKFIECYFFKKGFLDGMAGFIIAVSAAYSVFLKFAKLWEKENVQS